MRAHDRVILTVLYAFAIITTGFMLRAGNAAAQKDTGPACVPFALDDSAAEVLYFPCVGDAFADELVTFRKLSPNYRVVDITKEDEGMRGFKQGYIVVIEYVEAKRVSGR